MEVEVTNEDGGDIGWEGETQEGLEGGRVINVIVKGDDAQDRWAVMDVGNEKARMAAEVGPDHTTPRDKLPLTSTRVPPGVHHHLGSLVRGEIGVMEVPVGVGRSSEDIEALAMGIVAGNADTGEPRFRHTQNIIVDVRGEQGMHSIVASSHVYRKDGLYHH